MTFFQWLGAPGVKHWAMIGAMIVLTIILCWLIVILNALISIEQLDKLGKEQLYSIILQAITGLKWIAFMLVFAIVLGQVSLTGTRFTASGRLGSMNVDSVHDMPPNTTVTKSVTEVVEKTDAPKA